MQQERLEFHERKWRDHWFVKNILAELPFIGGIFSQSDPLKALDIGLKYTSMLVGGTAAMVLPMHDESGTDNIVKMGGKMALGMAGGTIAYNGVRNTAVKAYNLFSFYYRNPQAPITSSIPKASLLPLDAAHSESSAP